MRGTEREREGEKERGKGGVFFFIVAVINDHKLSSFREPTHVFLAVD